MLTRAQEEKDQRGPTSRVLNVSRSLAERAAANVPMSTGGSGVGSASASFARSGGSTTLMQGTVHPVRRRCKRAFPGTMQQVSHG